MSFFCRAKLPKSPRLDCGAVCCAYGLGTTLPSWQESGLTLVPEPIPIYFKPCNDAAEILGLSIDQWAYLFLPFTYKREPLIKIKPLDVVNHINVLLGTPGTRKLTGDGYL